jgi:hypothetical protein
MNELSMDYKVMDGNPCEWTPFIMWSCSMLVFMTSGFHKLIPKIQIFLVKKFKS